MTNILAYVHLRNIWGSTGAGRLARNMVEQLHRIGEDRIVVLADPADHRSIIPKVQEPWNGYEYRFLSRGTSKQQALWLLLNRPTAETYWPDAEIVYCTGESYVPVRKARLAVTVHDAAFFEPDAHRQDWALRKQRLKWRILYHRLSQHADRLFTVSQFSAERLAHYFPAVRDRLRVVPSAVSQSFYEPVSPGGERALAAIGLSGRRFVMVPGGLHYRKNAPLILQAWSRLREKYPDLLLVVIGHCDPAYLDEARRLGPSVRLTGYVDDDLMRSIYHGAAAVWFPSLYEGFGLPPLEAMACGTAVVASDCASLPEVIGGAALLVSPSAPNAHIEALESLLNNPSLRDKYVAAGYERASVYTWPAAANKLRSEFQSIA